jgi:phosphoglycolate phosphatase
VNLIFDLDGTLIDSRPGIVESLLFATSKTLGRSFNADLLQIGPPIKVMIEQVFPGTPDKIVEEIVKYFREHYDSIGWGIYNTYPKVKDVLEILKEQNILFIATNKPKKPTKKILQDMGVAHLFKKVVCYDKNLYQDKSDMVHSLKEKDNVLYKMIGDSNDDLFAAYDNSIDFIECTYGYGSITPPHSIDRVKIKKFEDLLHLKGKEGIC